jgi:hypothetical protein
MAFGVISSTSDRFCWKLPSLASLSPFFRGCAIPFIAYTLHSSLHVHNKGHQALVPPKHTPCCFLRPSLPGGSSSFPVSRLEGTFVRSYTDSGAAQASYSPRTIGQGAAPHTHRFAPLQWRVDSSAFLSWRPPFFGDALGGHGHPRGSRLGRGVGHHVRSGAVRRVVGALDRHGLPWPQVRGASLLQNGAAFCMLSACMRSASSSAM